MAPTAKSYGALMTAMHKSRKWQKGPGSPLGDQRHSADKTSVDSYSGEKWLLINMIMVDTSD